MFGSSFVLHSFFFFLFFFLFFYFVLKDHVVSHYLWKVSSITLSFFGNNFLITVSVAFTQ
jgi:hypothetical protein